MGSVAETLSFVKQEKLLEFAQFGGHLLNYFYAQDRALDMGLADGTYEVLEETMASLLEKEEETLKFIWMRPSNCKSGGLLRRLLVKGKGTDVGRLNIPNTADLAFI